MSNLKAHDRLRPQQIVDELNQLPAWKLGKNNQFIERQLQLSDFAEAFRFMTEIAAYAEAINHHPEWCNVWNRLDIKLTTHSAAGITARDFQFARHVEECLDRYAVICGVSGEGCGGCR